MKHSQSITSTEMIRNSLSSEIQRLFDGISMGMAATIAQDKLDILQSKLQGLERVQMKDRFNPQSLGR